MLNQLVLVGRINYISETGDKIVIASTRSYKNMNGEYETDFIPCFLHKPIANNVVEYCEKGDLIGIKGRVESKEDKTIIIAEKVTFLSTKKESEEK